MNIKVRRFLRTCLLMFMCLTIISLIAALPWWSHMGWGWGYWPSGVMWLLLLGLLVLLISF